MHSKRWYRGQVQSAWGRVAGGVGSVAVWAYLSVTLTSWVWLAWVMTMFSIGATGGAVGVLLYWKKRLRGIESGVTAAEFMRQLRGEDV